MLREVRTSDVCRLRQSDPWPVYSAGLPWPGVARSLFKMRGVQPVPGRDVHLLRTGRENVLQERLCKVGFFLFRESVNYIQSHGYVGYFIFLMIKTSGNRL